MVDFDKRNPFDWVVAVLMLVYIVYANIIITALRIWHFLTIMLWGWLFLTLLMPSINFWEHWYWLGTVLVVDPSIYVFENLVQFGDFIREDHLIPAENPLKIGFLLLSWLAVIGLTLIIVPAYWFLWVFMVTYSFYSQCSSKVQGYLFQGLGAIYIPDNTNITRIFAGHTTLQGVYDADIQAAAIAGALKKD